jgi:hypothetical protein
MCMHLSPMRIWGFMHSMQCCGSWVEPHLALGTFQVRSGSSMISYTKVGAEEGFFPLSVSMYCNCIAVSPAYRRHPLSKRQAAKGNCASIFAELV